MDPGCMENVFEDQSYDVRTQHDHQNIHKDPKKIVAGDFEDPVQGSWLFYQKSCQWGGGDQNVDDRQNNPKNS